VIEFSFDPASIHDPTIDRSASVRSATFPNGMVWVFAACAWGSTQNAEAYRAENQPHTAR
jgi:hypothetical protein